MTLILTVLNCDQAVMVSDRRLIFDERSRPPDDDYNKGIIYTLRDARVGVAFCGRARLDSFDTRTWLLEVLPAVAGPDYLLRPTAGRLALEAEERFQSLRGGPHRLSIVLAGFRYNNGQCEPHYYKISNFETFDGSTTPSKRFLVNYAHHVDPEVVLVDVSGRRRAVLSADVSRLGEMAARRVPADAIRAKAVSVLRAASDRAQNPASVGKTFTCSIIPRDPHLRSLGLLVQETILQSGRIQLGRAPDVVRATGHSSDIVLAGPSIVTPPFTVARSRPNVPCGCGSGKKYKHCHGAGDANP